MIGTTTEAVSLALAVAFLAFATTHGRPKKLAFEGSPPLGGPARTNCDVNEIQYWGTQEEGCRGDISIHPGSCICDEGWFRRESDWACVRQQDCKTCGVNEAFSTMTTEPGCNGDTPVYGGCICVGGFYRRESDWSCVQSCSRSTTEIFVPCTDQASATRLCSDYCPVSRYSWYCNTKVPGRADSITCTCH